MFYLAVFQQLNTVFLFKWGLSSKMATVDSTTYCIPSSVLKIFPIYSASTMFNTFKYRNTNVGHY